MRGGGDGECRKKREAESQLEQGRRSKGTELGRDRYHYLIFNGAERNGPCPVQYRQPWSAVVNHSR